MACIPPLNDGTVEAIAKVLGDAGSGTDITRYLRSQGLADNSGESTKWKRLLHVFLESQRATKGPFQNKLYI